MSVASKYARKNNGVLFEPTSHHLEDTGINTNEEVASGETAIDVTPDATTAIPVGSKIKIDSEYMVVTATGNTITVERTQAVTHSTATDIYKKVQDCVLWYPGQDDAHSAVIKDRSGKGNDGTITSGTWLRTSKGLWYNEFDGANTLINCGSAASIDDIFDGGGSLVAWINPKSSGEGTVSRVFSKETTNVGWNLRARDEAGGGLKLQFIVEFDGAGDGTWRTNNTSDLLLNVWSLVTVTYNADATANNPIFYTNGAVAANTEQVAPQGTRISDAAINFTVGNTPVATATFDGGIALARASTKILTLSEIAGLYNQERHLFGV